MTKPCVDRHSPLQASKIVGHQPRLPQRATPRGPEVSPMSAQMIDQRSSVNSLSRSEARPTGDTLQSTQSNLQGLEAAPCFSDPTEKDQANKQLEPQRRTACTLILEISIRARSISGQGARLRIERADRFNGKHNQPSNPPAQAPISALRSHSR